MTVFKTPIQPALLFLVGILFINISCTNQNRITANNVSLLPYYTSNMVFQNGKPIVIKGKSTPNGVLAIELASAEKYVTSDEKGSWECVFPAPDLSKSFTISIKGQDKTIQIKNVILGDVWLLIGDSWLPAYQNFIGDKEFSGEDNENVRIFQPSVNYGCKNSFKAEWKKLKSGKVYKYETFSHILGNGISKHTDLPVGIINLTWPGIEINEFDPVFMQKSDSVFSECEKDSLWNQYFLALKYNDSLAANSFQGINKGVTQIRYDDSDWSELDLPVCTGDKWFLKNRILWWRRRIYIESKYINSDFKINFGPIRGDFRFYFNEKEVGNFSGETKDYTLVIPDSLVRVWSNQLAVRMVTSDSLSGFYSDNILATNAGLSYKYRLNSGWKYRTYLEPQIPVVEKSKWLDNSIEKKWLNYIECADCEGIIVDAGYLFYRNSDSKMIERSLKKLSSPFNCELKMMYLIPEPTYIDSVNDYPGYAALRNEQLIGAAPGSWVMINISDIPRPTEEQYYYSRFVDKLVARLPKSK